MTTEEEMVLNALHNSFVAEAIALVTDLTRIEVSKAIVEIKAMAAVGEATMEVIPPESAGKIADIMERNLKSRQSETGYIRPDSDV